MLKLHIGCGKIYKKGYINIDFFDRSVADLIVKADNLPYKTNSVDVIENFHLLEHFSYKECSKVLEEWFRVLKPGGTLTIEVPDLIEEMKIFIKSSYHKRWECYREEFPLGRIQTIYGSQKHTGQFHKSGYDEEKIKRLLKEHSFIDIKVTPVYGTPEAKENIKVVCEKPIAHRKIYETTFSVKSRKKRIRKKSLVLRKLKEKFIFILRFLSDVLRQTAEKIDSTKK